MIQLQASARLQVTAANANEKKAKKYLGMIGFEGLVLKKSENDFISYTYQGYNPKKLKKMLGDPKGGTKSDSIRYNVPGQGVIAIWPDKGVVVMKNSKRN